MAEQSIHTWDLWFPQAAATGLPFARCKIDPAPWVLVHSAPPGLEVEVRTASGKLVARGADLSSTTDSPMTRLKIVGDRIEREDIWPGEADLECIVLLPGGEAGKLLSWWHAPDHTEWRWQVEFYNHK